MNHELRAALIKSDVSMWASCGQSAIFLVDIKARDMNIANDDCVSI